MYRDDGEVPNNPVLPVVVVKGAILPGQGPRPAMALLASNRWGGNWASTIFDYQHYHPNAHEALIVCGGRAEVQLGGPSGDIFEVSDGDAIVLPAGTGHCRLSGDRDFMVCGGYPPGQENYEIVSAGSQSIAEAHARIAMVSMPATCPIFAGDGPLLTAWPG